MAKVILFRRHAAALYTLKCSARLERSSKAKPWLHPRERPERLGNMLQKLAHDRPSIVYVIENMVTDIVTTLEREALGLVLLGMAASI